jgi:hypothetical protein
MYRFAATLIPGIIATVLVSGIAFMPTPVGAAKMSNAEKRHGAKLGTPRTAGRAVHQSGAIGLLLRNCLP